MVMPRPDAARDRLFEGGRSFDVIVAGGGITGAAILAEAARAGLCAVLLEQRDFAWGTSSRSSKLVHGGLRYLKQLEIRLTRDAARERRRLVEQETGLVEPLGFLVPTYRHDRATRLAFGVGLAVYDALAQQWTHRRLDPEAFLAAAPAIASADLDGGYRYLDARTDDARLVLRVLHAGVAAGGEAFNGIRVDGLLRDGSGRVRGVQAREAEGGRTVELPARVVVNATGAWADGLREQVGATRRIRPLRGSHLVFPHGALPAAEAMTLLHPRDRRVMFVIPWEGVTLVGTTDLDHPAPLDEEPAMSAREAAYVLEALAAWFPGLRLRASDALSSYAGVRPVIGSGQADPSKESRDHVVWNEQGLLTVTGGKLTTFRLIARDALRAVAAEVGRTPPAPTLLPRATLPPDGLDPAARERLAGRYGADAAAVVAGAGPGELDAIAGTTTTWAELRFAAAHESVLHLDDLLLRRTRLGLLLPHGGRGIFGDVRTVCGPALGWDDARWRTEEDAYRALWERAYAPPRLDPPA